jgi:cell division protease FtsH
VSFAPNPRSRTGLSPVVRTMLFWVLMVGLAVVLWQIQKKPNDSESNHAISYSDFLQQTDKNNIADATFVLSQNTADVHGNLRDSAQEYRTTIPKESISDLTDRLRKQGANVDVSEAPKQTTESYLINLAPLLLLVGFWIFMMQRIRGKQTTSKDTMPPPNTMGPSNTPL